MTEAPVAPRLRDLLYGFLFYVIALILFGFGVRVVQGLAAPMHGADPRLVTRVPIPMSVTLAGHGVVTMTAGCAMVVTNAPMPTMT